MLKRYAAELADHVPGENEPMEVRVPGEVSQGFGKTFQMTKRFEYRRIDRPATEGLLTEAQLNSLGLEGWELAGVANDADGVHFFLKRLKGG